MLGQRRRRWSGIRQTLGEDIVFSPCESPNPAQSGLFGHVCIEKPLARPSSF